VPLFLIPFWYHLILNWYRIILIRYCRSRVPSVTREEPTSILELCPIVHMPEVPGQKERKHPRMVFPAGGCVLCRSLTSLVVLGCTPYLRPAFLIPTGRHHVFLPAGGTIPPGSKCPVCDWTYSTRDTLKVRMWSMENRIRNMVRNPIILQV
jgi:hypothetical protein